MDSIWTFLSLGCFVKHKFICVTRDGIIIQRIRPCVFACCQRYNTIPILKCFPNHLYSIVFIVWLPSWITLLILRITALVTTKYALSQQEINQFDSFVTILILRFLHQGAALTSISISIYCITLNELCNSHKKNGINYSLLNQITKSLQSRRASRTHSSYFNKTHSVEVFFNSGEQKILNAKCKITGWNFTIGFDDMFLTDDWWDLTLGGEDVTHKMQKS